MGAQVETKFRVGPYEEKYGIQVLQNQIPSLIFFKKSQELLNKFLLLFNVLIFERKFQKCRCAVLLVNKVNVKNQYFQLFLWATSTRLSLRLVLHRARFR
eukprot:TRINITY_DN17441_c0_g1_i6.p2 TRINITY_DN17441_c0_g1~~TRINITY_DN17441_c0_g1_i6.p2  ORF type:complete len:100 (+),score=6.84 TRINITY_DN17441_c0_g1_i6:73-372(+)